MAIVLDGEIVRPPPTSASRFSAAAAAQRRQLESSEAITNANMLENPLETPVHIDAMNQVNPTLGTDSIHKRHLFRRGSARCWWCCSWPFITIAAG